MQPASLLTKAAGLLYAAAYGAYVRLPLPQSLRQRFVPGLSFVTTWLRKHHLAPEGTDATLNGYTPFTNDSSQSTKFFDIVLFSNIDWDYRKQRAQHLAQELARRGYRVLFVCSEFVNEPEPGAYVRIGPVENLRICRLAVSGKPLIYYRAPSQAVVSQLRTSCTQLCEQLSAAGSPPVAIVQHPYWYGVLEHIPFRKVVYDCMDYHEGFANAGRSILDLEHRLIRDADLVVVTSSGLRELIVGDAQSIEVIRNATEFQHFSKQVAPPSLPFSRGPVIGYYGAISHWLDLELIVRIAEEFSDAQCVLVGNDGINARKTLASHSNVHFPGEIAYTDLPSYLHCFDVCLLPFKVNKLTECTNPIKIYEYLSAGKAVVSVDLPEMNQFGNLVYVAGDHASFVDCVRLALSEEQTDEMKNRRCSFASCQSWANRAVEYESALLRLCDVENLS